MAKYSIKCSRCGAPIQWNNASLNVSCEYCGQPVNQFEKENNFKNKFYSLLKKIPLPSKESIRDKSKTLLSKQNVLSESQLELVESNLKIFFSKKRNIAILVSIPIAAWGYMKINYPIKAKPFMPLLLTKPSIPKETGEFVIYYKSNNLKERQLRRYVCRKKSGADRSKCINITKKNKSFLDVSSKEISGDWLLFKQAYSENDESPSTTFLDSGFTSHYADVAVNCKKKLLAFYSFGFPAWYDDFDTWSETDNKQFKREIPLSYVKKMGKLWWASNYSYNEDFENGEYQSWHKNNIRERKKRLSEVKDKNYCPYREGFKHKCTPLAQQESINTVQSLLNYDYEALKRDKLRRKRDAVNYNKLLKTACKYR